MRRYPKGGGQFAIIWADLLYEDSVPATGKLLFGEIYRLSGPDGYCDATNEELQEFLGCSETTVRNLLRALEDANQIRIELSPKREEKGGTHRRIFCGRKLAPPDLQEVPAENCGTRKKLRGVPAENCGYSLYKNNNNKNNTPIAPKEILEEMRLYAGENAALLEALMGFAEKRARKKNPIDTARSLHTLLNKLDKLSGGRVDVKIRMLDTATEHGWASVYALRADELPAEAYPAAAGQDERRGRCL